MQEKGRKGTKHREGAQEKGREGANHEKGIKEILRRLFQGRLET